MTAETFEARRAGLVDQLRRIDEAREAYDADGTIASLWPVDEDADPVALIRPADFDEAETLTRAGVYEAEAGLLELLGGAE